MFPFLKNNKKIQESVVYGDELGFVEHEAYRLLRTNLAFSFAGERKCRVLGIVSSVKGEGKTTTAINLSYVIAENNAKVCLIEGDMRMANVAKQLDLESKNGLSEYLTGQIALDGILKVKKFNKCEFSVITAGRMPPNPTELLHSPKMTELLSELSNSYDYIIVDLPPVTIVSDALVIGSALDGMIVTVGQGVARKRQLKITMRQLALAKIKVLGFVRTFTTDEGTPFGKYRKYSKYGKYGDYGYYGAEEQEKDTEKKDKK